jgi:hypothetical protein
MRQARIKVGASRDAAVTLRRVPVRAVFMMRYPFLAKWCASGSIVAHRVESLDY